MKRSIFGALLLASSMFAEVFPRSQDSLFWDGGRLVRVEGSNEVLGSSRSYRILIQQPGPPKPTERQVKLPPGIEGPHLVAGTFYGTRRSKTAGKDRLEVLSSQDGETWNALAYLERDPVRTPVSRAFSIDGEHFVLIATMGDFVLDKQRSRMALARIEGGKLAIQELVDMGYPAKAPAKAPPKNPGGVIVITEDGADPASGSLGIFAPRAVHFPRGVALVSERTGYLWCLYRGEGSSIKTRLLKLYPSVDSAFVRGEPIESPVLGCQPGPDGRLLLASRSEQAVLGARAYFKDETRGAAPLSIPKATPSSSPEAEMKRLAEALRRHIEASQTAQAPLEARILRDFPDILWWSIDPENGSITRVEAPEGAPSRIDTVETFRAFRFHFRLNGGVSVFD